MKKYIVDLTDLGVKRKVVLFKGESRDLIHGQPTSNLDVVNSYPQYFKEIVSEETQVEVVETVETVEIEETQVEVVETVETVETPVEVVETVEIEETPVEVVETPETIEEVLRQAGEFKTKAELEEFGLKYGINLNRQNSMKNMIKELETHLTK